MYKQAILDAKAVRASAMANAKASLQEAFEPKIQEMIRLKLSEELSEELDEEYTEMEEGKGGSPIIVPANDANDLDEEAEYFEEMLSDAGIMAKVKAGIGELEIYVTDPADKKKAEKAISKAGYTMDEAKEDDSVDEATLEEILAELEELTNEDADDDMIQATNAAEDQIMEAEDDEDDDTDTDDTEETDDTDTDDTETEDAPTDDTKIIDITLGDLKTVLQSLDGGTSEIGGMEDIDLGDTETETETETDTEELAEIDLDEILNSLEEAKTRDKKKKEMEEKKKMTDSDKKSLQEAKKTITILRNELNEVNLLNAKLLYMNKIFKSKNLSESQKVNVVSALDRASNTKEAKNIYETLKETLSSKKSQIQESRGFASKPAGVAPKKPIVEADAFVSRWQKIAGIK